MAIDLTSVTHTHTPPRMKLFADYLVSTRPAELAALNASDNAFYTYVNAHVGAFDTPTVLAGVYAKTVGTNVKLYLSSDDPHTPISYFYSLSDIVAYGATVAGVPTAAVTSTTPVANISTIANAGFVAGCDFKIAVQAHQFGSTNKSDLILLEAIYAPAAPTTIAASSATGHSVVTWYAMSGAASYDIYYIANAVGTENAATVISTGVHFTGTANHAGTTITAVAGVLRVTVTATNPGGTSLGGTAASGTIS